jgi:hypothetical protein
MFRASNKIGKIFMLRRFFAASRSITSRRWRGKQNTKTKGKISREDIRRVNQNFIDS